MTTSNAEYSKAECDARTSELTGGNAVPIEVQGVCSYSVYARPEQEYVVQFRLKSLELKNEILNLASKVYGSLAPTVSFKGVLGAENSDREPLYIYVMNRVKGITHLDFILAKGFPENSEVVMGYRKELLTSMAKFFARSWKAPQQVDPAFRDQLRQKYVQDLASLDAALPDRFKPVTQQCIDSMDAIFSLPIVLTHKDFGVCNIMVDENTCRLVGVIDWAEAESCPFGTNLHSLQAYTGKFHLKNGWLRYEDYDDLQKVFWSTFQEEVGPLSDVTLKNIKMARILGLLRSRGFTSRLANEPEAAPIGDDAAGRYKMMYLDGFLINEATRFD